MKVLLIGESPNASHPDGGRPLMGAIGYRLADLAGLTLAEYTDRTERVNLFERFPGAVWPRHEARAAAEALAPRLSGRTTLLLGQKVAAAFGWHSRVFSWVRPEAFEYPETRLAVIPHPSSRNLWWNDPENRAAARRFLRATVGTDE